MRLSYTYTHRDSLLCIDIITDLECTIEFDSSFDCGDIIFDVTAVFVEGRNLFRGEPDTQRIAARIATEATDKLNTTGTRLRERALAMVEMEAA